jgi:hypothetical protein
MITRTRSVTMRALAQRINRKLAKDNECLKKARSIRDELNVGQWFIVDLERNFVTAQHVEPEALGRELGVLQPWESLD